MAQAAEANTTTGSRSRAHVARSPALARRIRNDGPSSDSKLLKLGHRASALEAWFDAQETSNRPDTDHDPEYLGKMDEHCDLLRRIMEMPAHTADGLRVKAERILHWCSGFDPDEHCETEGLLGLSLARDLARHA